MNETCADSAPRDVCGRGAANSQRDLIAFILATLEDTSSEAQETGFFIALVIWRYFSREKDLKRVTEKSITQQFSRINEDLAAFEQGQEHALERVFSEESIKGSEVLQFIAEEIQAAREEDAIIEDEAGHLFVVLKVVVECLEDAASVSDDGH